MFFFAIDCIVYKFVLNRHSLRSEINASLNLQNRIAYRISFENSENLLHFKIRADTNFTMKADIVV